ncbi:GCN5-related N-acetyltransferase [Desulfitobacterium hafniense DCB-2]|uniref:Acetyltransferase, ribosomal protein N-acetylase n=4 Tax=root TaxID=1 RepID=A0A098B906_DESHA|nr:MULTISPECIES: GNAT family N-acetyltransferase [Desulfitobacterium]ACL19316.1 GCN5-related N-acetyltransferase [Desulfitobacterium hafniense DCB-2]MEA5021914.1 GNAT family N-acetyltransferase [Desulfitobacterium hafniense]CDX04331.1 Acetyltransferase, ribosomal protein N-acetylase [Desulfitobacterium hafniense]SHN64610.1 ribosomal-protein-alanine N-acetyltransferase [Desulfitobacterium chlororespirans DSM 11544]
MRHRGTKELETEGLILRRFELTDAEAMFKNWANDGEVTKYLTWPPHENVEVSLEVLKDWVSLYEDEKFYQWAIVLKENGSEPIGSISIVKMDDRIDMVHVGYCIGKRWWGKGVTSEALAELMRFFFAEVQVNRIESRHDPRNPNSGKVMKKCGLLYEGTLKQGDRCNQGICDCSMYGLVAEDYYANHQR